MMKTHEFSIIASGLDPKDEQFEATFYNAGCDDATVSFQKGHIILDFAREAKTVRGAIESAIADVRAAGAHVDRVEPDPLVSLSDIAARVGKTRQAISLMAKGERGVDFPAPVARITSNTPMWDWADVSNWFYNRGELAKEDAEEASAVSAVNAALQKADAA